MEFKTTWMNICNALNKAIKVVFIKFYSRSYSSFLISTFTVILNYINQENDCQRILFTHVCPSQGLKFRLSLGKYRLKVV